MFEDGETFGGFLVGGDSDVHVEAATGVSADVPGRAVVDASQD